MARDAHRPPVPAPFTFYVDGAPYVLRQRPVRWWLHVLASRTPACWLHAVVFNLHGDGTRRLLGRLYDNTDGFDLDQVEDLAVDVVGHLCGMDGWAAQRLAVTARSSWLAFDAWCIRNGFDPGAHGLGRAVAAVYAWRFEACKKQSDVAKLDNEVFAKPPMRRPSGRLREAAPRTWSDEQESAAFMAALKQVGKA